MTLTDNENVGIAFALVIGAGAATGLGASVVFFPSLAKLASRKTLASALGLSAGVMIYVSFAEILVKSTISFEYANFSKDRATLFSTLCFFAGVVFMVMLNTLVTKILGGHHHHDHDHDRETCRATRSSGDDEESSDERIACPCHDEKPVETLEKVQFMAREIEEHNHPKQQPQETNQDDSSEHSNGFGKGHVDPQVAHRHLHDTTDVPVHDVDDEEVQKEGNSNENAADDEALVHNNDEKNKNDKNLMRMSLNTALAIGLHNFPEGLATFVATLDNPKVGGVLAVAIAIHNIPEGLCVAMPIYYATGNRWQAFGWAMLSGIAEALAGLLAWLILANSFSDTLYAVLFGMVAGMMVIIAVRELMPTAHRYDPEDSVVTVSFIVGMGIMALSLVLFLL